MIRYLMMCCLAFATVMILGLSIQSCKANRSLQSDVQTEEVRYSAYERGADSLMFTRMLEQYHRNFALEILRYVPAVDTTGKVTGSVLQEQIRLTLQDHSFKDNTSVESGQVHVTDTVSVHTLTDTQIDDKSWSPSNLTYIVIAILLLIFIIIKLGV